MGEILRGSPCPLVMGASGGTVGGSAAQLFSKSPLQHPRATVVGQWLVPARRRPARDDNRHGQRRLLRRPVPLRSTNHE